MSKAVTFRIQRDNADVVFDSVVFEDEGATYGVREVEGLSVLVAAGTALTDEGDGSWSYTIPTLVGFDYELYYKATESGSDSYYYGYIDGDTGEELSTEGRYTSLGRINSMFGQANVAKWSQVNGAATLDVLRIQGAAIVDAEAYIDAALRNNSQYVVPFTSPIPAHITTIATILAGVNMYEAKGVLDWDPESGRPTHRLHYQRKRAMTDLDRIRTGRIHIDETTDAVNYMEAGS